LGENATGGVFVGPYGPYVRDLLPGEPSDALLLRDPGAAKAFYQDVWADDDAGFMKSTSEVGGRQGGRGTREGRGMLTSDVGGREGGREGGKEGGQARRFSP
jgi:hypothetical protein